MGSSYENRKQIVDTWVKLEKCLDEFDSEVMNRKNRPMSSMPAPNKFQISRKRPDSSKFGHSAQPAFSKRLLANPRATQHGSAEVCQAARFGVFYSPTNDRDDRTS